MVCVIVRTNLCGSKTVATVAPKRTANVNLPRYLIYPQTVISPLFQCLCADETVRTAIGKKAIVACGAYTNDILKSFGIHLNLDIWEMVYQYYAVTSQSPALFPSMWFQASFPLISIHFLKLY